MYISMCTLRAHAHVHAHVHVHAHAHFQFHFKFHFHFQFHLHLHLHLHVHVHAHVHAHVHVHVHVHLHLLQVDPGLNLVKGGGGALLREKMVEVRAKKFVCIVDESKLCVRLGPIFPLPVEVTQFCAEHTRRVRAQP